MTLYGSRLDYNIATGQAHIKNARILTSDFNLVATELIRVNENEYIANEAEFTTCKDCAESWSVYGKYMKVHVGKFIQISNGLFKVKGVDVLYIPYLVLPILAKRETGLLIPRISSRSGEGLSFEQPFFWALGDNKDLTLSPTFWAERGYGGDLQYRQRFDQMTWFEFNGRAINDTIYEPGKKNRDQSGDEFFRYFTDIEAHKFFSPDLSSHFRYTGTRDLDLVQDYPQYTAPKVSSSDFGLQGFVNWRQKHFSMSGDVNYSRNQLFSDPIEFDRSYVQTIPRLTFNTIPNSIYQSKIPFLNHIAVGADGSFTRFRQVDRDDTLFLRNADRVSVQPYLMWHLLTMGPVSLRTRYTFDQQSYQFADRDEANAGKNAGLVRTEISFTMDKVFGLAYEEKVPIRYISEKDLKRLRESKEQGLSPLQKEEKENRLVGELPNFESELSKDSLIQLRNSFRHSQEFKFLHHYITSQNEFGNKRFIAQIQDQRGLFDYEDAVRSQEYTIGANTTRTLIPPENTLELQWNNSLIRKTPKSFSFLEDEKYLRDNFTYTKLAWFNVSQGYLLNEQDQEDLNQRLTRLMIDTGYYGDRWSTTIQETYFHSTNENILGMSVNRRFEYLNIFGRYINNSLRTSELHTASVGGQVRPTDILGLAMMKDIDLQANKDIRTTYSADIMPHNNCYIFSLNYQRYLGNSRYSFNINFNFGQDNFDRYRNDYFGVKRL